MKRITKRSLAFCLAAALAALPFLSESCAAQEADAAAEAYQNPFAAMEVNDLFGEPFDSSVFDGKPFMINVWATWCGPCLMELPAIEALSARYADRITIVGLLTDAAEPSGEGTVRLIDDEIEGAKAVYQAKSLSYPTLIPNFFLEAAAYQLGLRAYPTTWFFNGEGQMLGGVEGARDEAQWAELIESVLEYVEGQDEGNVS